MRVTEYVCDECGKKRSSDTNHWRTIFISASKDFVSTNFGFMPLDSDREVRDVCGQECATQTYSRWLSTGKLKA